MADATEPKATAKPRKAPARKTATAKAEGATAPKKRAASASKKPVASSSKQPAAKAQGATPTFSESVSQARTAINTASAAARAKVKDVADKANIDWQTQSEKWKHQGEKVKAQSEQLYEQASKMARDAADSAKARTGTAIQGLARLINDTAETVDTKLGPQYGDYARQAASTVANAAQSLDEKDIDQLLDEARDFVRKSPAVAIGAAAIAGFVLMRLAKGTTPETETDDA